MILETLNSFIGSSSIKGIFFSIKLTSSLNEIFAILSSREWNEIMTILPPFFSFVFKFTKQSCKLSISSFTAIRRAWNDFVAGCFLVFLFLTEHISSHRSTLYNCFCNTSWLFLFSIIPQYFWDIFFIKCIYYFSTGNTNLRIKSHI